MYVYICMHGYIYAYIHEYTCVNMQKYDVYYVLRVIYVNKHIRMYVNLPMHTCIYIPIYT